MPMHWEFLHPQVSWATLGFMPDMFSDDDPRPAREQVNNNYRHGGGWFPVNQDKYRFDLDTLTYTYPGDPPQTAIARTRLRDETILIFDYGMVAIVQKDGSYEIARMD